MPTSPAYANAVSPTQLCNPIPVRFVVVAADAGLAEHRICEYPVQPRELAVDLTANHLVPDKSGELAIPDAPGLGITVDEAIRVNTIHGAYNSHEEGLKGSITTGKLADFVVLADDPHTVAPDKIKDVRVWFNNQKPDLTSADLLQDLGGRLVADLKARAKEIARAAQEAAPPPGPAEQRVEIHTAAELLGIKPGTLAARMKKLDLRRP